jgi:hypothetical protein
MRNHRLTSCSENDPYNGLRPLIFNTRLAPLYVDDSTVLMMYLSLSVLLVAVLNSCYVMAQSGAWGQCGGTGW